MRKIKCIKNVYMYITLGKDYDVVKYDHKTNLVGIYNDENILTNIRMNIKFSTDNIVYIFDDITSEYRNDVINGILK